jgi:SHS2 domain-containing protein
MSYEWIDHTAELELRIEAPTEAAVFEHALQAVRELLVDSDSGESVSRELVIEADDRAALLAAWIEELVYLAETEGLVPERVTAIQLHGGGLAASITASSAEPPHLIKAATYHRLQFEPSNGGFRATVVLDV